MKFGKLQFGNWNRFAGGVEIPGHENIKKATLFDSEFCIEARHDKHEAYQGSPLLNRYSSTELSNWKITFHEFYGSTVKNWALLQEAYDALYKNEICATEEGVKIHIINFMERMNKLKFFI